jgi:hypothetical protein
MMSVVCVYNNKKILKDNLLESLGNQTIPFELITIDNTERKYKSAAEALNYGGIRAIGKYLMFIHQDVDLSSDTWLEDAETLLDSLSNLGIAGVAGKKNGKFVISNIEHGYPPSLAGSIQFSAPTKAQTLDECLVIIPRSIFGMLKFDQVTCDDWHLYAVDYCLSVKRLGFDVYLIPFYIYHGSKGYSFSERYYITLEKLIEKHKKHFDMIYTTMGDWSVSALGMQRLKLWRLIYIGKKLFYN